MEWYGWVVLGGHCKSFRPECIEEGLLNAGFSRSEEEEEEEEGEEEEEKEEEEGKIRCSWKKRRRRW